MACTALGACGASAIAPVGVVPGYVLAHVQTHLLSLVDLTVHRWDLVKRLNSAA